MSSTFDLSNPDRTIHVGVIVLNSTTEILDVAPIDILSGLSSAEDFEIPEDMDIPAEVYPPEVRAQRMDFKFHWVSEAGPPSLMKFTSGIQMQPTDSFETCPPLDIVLLGAHNIKDQPTEAELAFVRKSYNDCSAFLTICGGVMVPLAAGLLEGKKATGPRFFLKVMSQMSPNTEWLEKRYVQDGKLWTSSTLLNGTDMMLAFAKSVWGKRGEKEGAQNIVEMTGKLGAWPARDIDFKDVPWAI